MTAVLVDTGPLVALLNRRDQHHAWAKAAWAELSPPLLTFEPVLAEACHILRAFPDGPGATIAMAHRGVLDVSFRLGDHAAEIARLLRKYASVPMSLADACMVRMAELLAGSVVLTLDSDFTIYRMHGRQVIPTISPFNVQSQ